MRNESFAYEFRILHRQLREMQRAGALDSLAADLHPDIINAFCDAVDDRDAANAKHFDKPPTEPTTIG